MNTNCLQPRAAESDYKGEREIIQEKKNASMKSNLKDSQKTTATFFCYMTILYDSSGSY